MTKNLLRISIIALLFVFISTITHQPITANDEVIATKDKLIVFKINDKSYYTQTIGSENVEVKQMDTAPIIYLDRTFVPVRFLGNALGVDDSNIEWNSNTRTASLKGSNKLDLTIGKSAITINGVSENIDVAPMITNSRTMLPARYVAEGLGFTVDWDADNQLVIVYQGERPDVSAIVAKIKGIRPTEPVEEEPVVEPKEPIEEVGVKVVDIPRSDDVFHKQYIVNAGYKISVRNDGVNDPGIWFGMSDESYPIKDIKAVCTSHPEWNKSVRPMINLTSKEFPMDVWTNSFKLYKRGYSPVEPQSGDRVTFDVYGKVDGAEVKLATVTKTLP
ncbi:MAG TPA: copper amine oxidase N-terminal domain-containing protein [Syntrophomonadaceae bacterium]|nr:copper amine oxidase N-terminal domain-containing protein [Syntrophomonadaceae bacterium]